MVQKVVPPLSLPMALSNGALQPLIVIASVVQHSVKLLSLLNPTVILKVVLTVLVSVRGADGHSWALNAFWQPEDSGLVPSISASVGQSYLDGDFDYNPADTFSSWMVGL